MLPQAKSLHTYHLAFLISNWFRRVILRSEATKNLIVTLSAEILRFAQNDMEQSPDGNELSIRPPWASP
jgi:hypothetical protein